MLFAFSSMILFVGMQAAFGIGAAPDCIDFEDPPLNTVYKVGDTFNDSGVDIDVEGFQWSNSTWTLNGYVEVENGGQAGGSGQEMRLNNASLDFHFLTPWSGLSLLFGEYGGNLNIIINGTLKNFEDFIDINGATIGGVNVSVVNLPAPDDDKGTLTLSGTIKAFSIGGQELWIDDVCPAAPGDMPDLIVESITGPSSACIGEALGKSITLIIQNIGAAPASGAPGYFHTDLVLSKNNVIGDADDILLIGGRDQVKGTLNPGVSLTVSLAGSNQIPAGTATGTYHLGAYVDSVSNLVAESDETNNTRFDQTIEITDCAGEPDLIVGSITGPQSACIGEALGDRITLIIKNIGTAPAAGAPGYFHTDLVLSLDAVIGNGDDVLLIGGRDQVYDVLNPGDILPVSLAGSNQIPGGTATGTYHLGAYVDSVSNLVAESDETNNTRSDQTIEITDCAGEPDLIVASIDGPSSACIGEALGDSITLTIQNIGTAPASGAPGYFHTDLVLSPDAVIGNEDDILLIGGRDQVHDVLNPGDSLDVSLAGSNQIPLGTLTGQYHLGAYVDAVVSHVAESNEDNNTGSYHPIEITDCVGEPDLIVQYITGPRSACIGEALEDRLTLIIQNIGDAPAFGTPGYFHTDLVLSPDAVIGNEDDVLLIGGRDQVYDALNPGDILPVSLAGSNQIPLGTAAGTYHLGAIVDSVGDLVAESDEDNNINSYQINIEDCAGEPDLIVQFVTGPMYACIGEALEKRLILVIQNVGTAPASGDPGYFHTDLVLSPDAVIGNEDDILLIGGRDQVHDALEPSEILMVPLAGSNQIPGDTPAGTYYLGAIVDSQEDVAESDEANNTYSYQIDIQDCQGEPDLIVEYITGPSSACIGEALGNRITLIIHNAGDAPAFGAPGYFHTDLVLSPDAVIGNGDDILLIGGRDQVFKALNPGESRQVSLAGINQIPGDTAAGTYHLGAFVDSQDDVAESDEDNNTGSYHPIEIKDCVGELDFGDALDRPYPTFLASNGARHTVDPDVFLGNRIDAEPDGQPDPNALGDDNDGNDDDDGVTFTSPLESDQNATVNVVASVDGFLSAWIDFDSNGSWVDPGDQIFFMEPLAPGLNSLGFHVPTITTAPVPEIITYARFRFSTAQRPLYYLGLAPDGEVEDYEVSIKPSGEPSECIDFEDPPPLKKYLVGDTFIDSGVNIAVEDFEWIPGNWTNTGFAKVVLLGEAGGSGQEMAVNNVNLKFDFGTWEGLSLLFGYCGGNINITINGDFRNEIDLATINGWTTPSGVNVSVTNLGTNSCGVLGSLELSGTINSFAIGGQELFIDDVCPGGGQEPDECIFVNGDFSTSDLTGWESVEDVYVESYYNGQMEVARVSALSMPASISQTVKTADILSQCGDLLVTIDYKVCPAAESTGIGQNSTYITVKFINSTGVPL